MPTAAELLRMELSSLRERLPMQHPPHGLPAQQSLTIIETGSIRSAAPAYEDDDGWSTLTFARDVAEHGGAVYSIDLDTTAAAIVLGERNLAWTTNLIQGHSIDVLAGMVREGYPAVDVAYLDSDNDAALILHEYLLVTRLLRSPALVIVDDVDPESEEVVKGHALLPWLETHAVPWQIITRSGPSVSTGMLVVRL